MACKQKTHDTTLNLRAPCSLCVVIPGHATFTLLVAREFGSPFVRFSPRSSTGPPRGTVLRYRPLSSPTLEAAPLHSSHLIQRAMVLLTPVLSVQNTCFSPTARLPARERLLTCPCLRHQALALGHIDPELLACLLHRVLHVGGWIQVELPTEQRRDLLERLRRRGIQGRGLHGRGLHGSAHRNHHWAGHGRRFDHDGLPQRPQACSWIGPRPKSWLGLVHSPRA